MPSASSAARRRTAGVTSATPRQLVVRQHAEALEAARAVALTAGSGSASARRASVASPVCPATATVRSVGREVTALTA